MNIFRIITIFIFIAKPFQRDYIFKLTFFLSISELINNTSYFLSLYFLSNPHIYENKIICHTQTLLITYSDISSLLWILMICYGIYDLFVNKNQYYDRDKEKFIIGCFLLPIIPALMYKLFNKIRCLFTQHNEDNNEIYRRNI